MALLANPQNRRDAIIQDYRDKHSCDGSVLVCRKYPKQVKNKNGCLVFDDKGNPTMYSKWYEAKRTTNSEKMYVYDSYIFSENNKNDVYCTLNGFPLDFSPVIKKDKDGNEKLTLRALERLAYFTGYYLDFDHIIIHELAKSKKVPPEIVNEVLSYKEKIVEILSSYFANDYGMPVITFTGGGYGFYIKIKPLPVNEENAKLYMAIWEALYKKFNEIFSSLLGVFENDHSVLDLVRVIRITGTYNSKSDVYSEYVARYGNEDTNEIYEYGIEEIIDLYDLKFDVVENEKKVSHSPLQRREEKKREEREEKTSNPISKESILKCINDPSSSIPEYIQEGNIIHPTKWYVGYVNDKQVGKYLELSIASLDYLQRNNQLTRNNALFMIACLKTEIEYSKYQYATLEEVSEEVQELIVAYIVDINNGLNNPLGEEELTSLLYSALKNIYHFRKKDTIQKYLNLSDVEFENIGWLDKKKKEEQKVENNKVLTDIDKKAIRLYLQGLSDAKVGKQLGLPKLKIIRLRQRLGVTDRTIKYEDIDFEGNRRHLKNKTNKQKEVSTIVARNTIPEEKVAKRFPIKYRDFFVSPIRSYSYFVKHNYNYAHLKNREKQELIKAYYLNKNNYMRVLGIRSIEDQHKQLNYLHNAMNEKLNLYGNIKEIKKRGYAPEDLGRVGRVTLGYWDDYGVLHEVDVSEQELFKPHYGEHLKDRVV